MAPSPSGCICNITSVHKVPGTPRKRRQKDCKSQRGQRTPRKQSLPNTARLKHTRSHRHGGSVQRACTGLSQMGSQNWEGKMTQALLPKSSPTDNCLQRKNYFSPMDLTGCANHSEGQAPMPRCTWPAQGKLGGILGISLPDNALLGPLFFLIGFFLGISVMVFCVL